MLHLLRVPFVAVLFVINFPHGGAFNVATRHYRATSGGYGAKSSSLPSSSSSSPFPPLLHQHGRTGYKLELGKIASILADLRDADDVDADDDDDEGTATMNLIDKTTKALETLVDAEESDHEISRETLSDLEGSVVEDNVSRRKITEASTIVTTAPKRVKSYAVNSQTKKISEPEESGELSIKSQLRFVLKLLFKIDKTFRVQKLEYATYGRHPEFPKYDLSRMMKLLKGNPPAEYFFRKDKVIRLLLRLVRHNTIGLDFLRSDDVERAETMEEKYGAFFTRERILFGLFPNPLNFVPPPKHALKNWESDKEVARQFLCGVNPVMIKVCSDVSVLPKTILDEFSGSKFNLEELSAQNRLFYVSYDQLAELEVNPHQAYPEANNPNRTSEQVDQPRHFYGPIAVFYVDKKEELDILCIQLERESDSKVHTPLNTDVETWEYVKMHLKNADSNIHEWVSHLGDTHLTMEPHIIAVHNTLKGGKDFRGNVIEPHPLYYFFKPLFKDTLFLNWASRFTLANFGEASFGDYATSVGVGQFMQLIEKKWQTYDFMESGLPSELKRRGFDESFEMPSYLYREDGLKLWEAYGKFTKDYVDEVYKSDDEVKADKRLQEWAIETCSLGKANIPGFPKYFEKKETVAQVMQIIYWCTSGLHAAVNFPQRDFYGYTPNKPLGVRSQMPESGRATRDFLFDETLAYIHRASEALGIVNILTLPSESCVDNLSDYYSKKPFGKTSYEKHLVELDYIGDLIEARNRANKRKKKGIYSYLNPTVIPAAIDI